jgi:cyclohexadienyl dehydratase
VFVKRGSSALALALLIGCALRTGEAPVRAPGTTASVQAPALRVGTSGDYRPFSFRDAGGTLAGFDIAVAERLALHLERSLELVSFRWPALTTQLQAGAFDLAMSGVTMRPERALHMAFTRPYAVTGAVAVIRVADRASFGTIDALDRPGTRIVVNAGGHLEQVARQRFRRARITPIPDNTALPTLLLNGDADAAISEELEARTWPTLELAVLGPFTHDFKAYALPPGDADLLRQLNAWLADQEDNGWLNQQRRKWFAGSTGWSPQQAGFEALVAAMELRLQLMPYVAAVKRREHLPVHDPAQEDRVLTHVRAAATAANLNADDVVNLFRVQIEAAKAVEHQAAEVTTDALLADVRAAVARASDAIIAELGRGASWLSEPQARDQLDGLLRRHLAGHGLPAAMVDALVHAACQVRVSTLHTPLQEQ